MGEQKWAALAHIRLMNYSEAMKIYEKLVEKSDADPSLYCYLGPGVMKLNMVYRKSRFRTCSNPNSCVLFLPGNVQKGRGYNSTSTTFITTK